MIMKILGLGLVLILAVSGCSTTYNHSESIDVDHFGATGFYRDNRQGTLSKFALIGGGGAGGSTVGLGGLGIVADSSQSQSDPQNFAKSIVMVDLSKKLKSIKVDDVEGIREYEYVQPLVKGDSRSSAPKSSLPSAFGHQPVE
jgi:hypothetical protein